MTKTIYIPSTPMSDELYTLAVALAKADPRELTRTGWIRELIREDTAQVDGRRLDGYDAIVWHNQHGPMNKRTGTICITPRLLEAMTKRIEWLRTNPNPRGWYPAATTEYIRALMEVLVMDKIPARPLRRLTRWEMRDIDK